MSNKQFRAILTISRGLVPNIIKVTPSIAVSFYTFETVKDLLAKWEHLEEREEDKVV